MASIHFLLFLIFHILSVFPRAPSIICVDKMELCRVCFQNIISKKSPLPSPRPLPRPRLLLTLTEEDFSRAPYSIENSIHRRAILMELEQVKALGVKPPQNLWEYKVNAFFFQLKKSVGNKLAVICLPTAPGHTADTTVTPSSPTLSSPGFESFLGVFSCLYYCVYLQL